MPRKKKTKEENIEVNTNADEPKNSTLNMDSLTAGEELPEVKENAIAAVQSTKETKIQQAKENGFDPEIHATNADGSPKLTQGGNFAKKRGRKSTINTGQKSAKQIQQELEAEKQAQENLESAIVVSGLLEQLQIKVISEEFAYDDNERAFNIKAWEKTFEYYGGVNIPPPAALAMNHAQIIMSRANKPKTKDKIGLFKAWFKSKLTFKKKVDKNALSDSGENPERKNNVRKEKSAQPEKTGD